MPRAVAPAGFLLRSLAFVVDLILVGAIVFSGKALVSLSSSNPDVSAAIGDLSADPDNAAIGHFLATHRTALDIGGLEFALFGGFVLYSALMVGIVGRTCGMMIFDLRVARGKRLTPGFFLAAWRYLLAALTLVTILPWFVGVATGWWVHERLSGTRLVRGGISQMES